MVSAEREGPAGQSSRNLRTPSESKSPVTGGYKVVRMLTNPRGSWARYRGGVRLPRLGVGLVAAAGALALGLAAIGPVSAHVTQLTNTASSSASGTGVYVPLSAPVRVLDTRSGTGFGALGPNSTSSLTVEGVAGVPSANVTAVVGNVTVTGGTSAGYLTVFPAGGATPYVSNVNFTAGETVANLATVPVGTSGMISFHDYLYNQAAGGSLQVIFDIQGYYTTVLQGGAGLYVPLSSPTRIADTRAGSGQPDAGTPLAPNSVTNLQVTGADGVPQGASAVVLNVTEAGATANGGYLTVYPQGATQPTASNLNFNVGTQIANRVIVGVSTSGQVSFYNFNGTTQLVVDVDGYYTAAGATSGSYFVPVTPTRVVDTRINEGGSTVAATGTENFQVAGIGSVPAEGTGTSVTGAVAVAANVTVVNTQANGYLTVWPSGETMPTASDVNWTAAGAIQPNFDIAGLNNSSTTPNDVSVYNGSGGSTDVVVDLFGYFTNTQTESFFNLTASPTTLPADGASTSTLTPTVYANGSQSTTDEIMYTDNGAAACGGFGNSSASTAFAAESSTETYTAGTSAGTCTITATEANGGTTASVVITQTATPTVSLTSFPTTTTAGTAYDFVVTVTSGGSPVSGATISATNFATANPTGACGTFLIPFATGSNGQAQGSYTAPSSGHYGYCSGYLKASWTVGSTNYTADSATETISQTGSVGAGQTANIVTITPAAATSAAGATTSIVVNVSNNVGGTVSQVSGDGVALTIGGSACTDETLYGTTAATTGDATFSYTAPATTSGGACTLSATEANMGQSGASDNTALSIQEPATSTTLQVPDNAANSAIASGTRLALVGSSTISVTTSGSVAANSPAGYDTITVTAALGQVFDAGDVVSEFYQEPSSSGNTVTVTANPASIVKGGAASLITVTDSDVATPGAMTITFTTEGAGTAPSTFTLTMTNGTGTFYYDSTATSGFMVITATDATGASGSTVVDQTA